MVEHSPQNPRKRRKSHHHDDVLALCSDCVSHQQDFAVQANSTFQFIDSIGDYAREWLSISQELHDFLRKPKTEHNLQAIREVGSLLPLLLCSD